MSSSMADLDCSQLRLVYCPAEQPSRPSRCYTAIQDCSSDCTPWQAAYPCCETLPSTCAKASGGADVCWHARRCAAFHCTGPSTASKGSLPCLLSLFPLLGALQLTCWSFVLVHPHHSSWHQYMHVKVSHANEPCCLLSHDMLQLQICSLGFPHKLSLL